MPLIKSAKKKLKQDKKRTQLNAAYKKSYKQTLKKARALKSSGAAKKGAEIIGKVYSTLDTAVKKGLIHKNKAARLKSKISKRR